MEEVKFLAQPKLKGTVAVLCFAGWANAGEVGTSTLTFLKEAVGPAVLAEIEADPFYDFTAHRPSGCVSKGRVTSLTRPSNTFYFASATEGPPTILFLGEEPHLNWDRYCQLILEVLLRFDTRLVITVGGTYDERLHTDPPLISYLAEDMVLAESVQSQGGRPGEYEGPISVHTYLYQACRQRGLPVVGLWGHAPAYVQTGNFHLVKKSIEMIAALGGP
ncbi:MAG: PAC2 family protein, partial [Deltaproteobacteria bacterium]|nr:PAC2 family protein [Deltaproteobacteria bacterium]